MRLLAFIMLGLSLTACAPAQLEAQSMSSAQGTGTLFVANKRGASLSRIDLATGEETHRAETCENPHELTVSPDAQFVLVACYSGRSVEVFSTESLAEAGTLFLGTNARVHSALWLPDGRVIAGAEGRGSLYSFEVQMQDGRVPPLFPWQEIGGGEGAARGPHLIAVSPDGRSAWGTFIEAGEVVLYNLDGAEEAARARIGNQIEAIALSPDGGSLWVASNADSIAYRLDPLTLEVLAEVPTGQVPIRLAMHPSGDYIVSSNFGSGDLTVIETRSNAVVRTIPVSGSRDAVQVTLVFSADGIRLYAAETATDTIAEIDFASGEVLRRIATGPGGDGLAVID
ncbi:YncE family protein [Erythrobacter sp. EC-HK427]|nr:beta-propeller fold lactonase family protein [Erythrobacter sp. EC-HK427]VVT13582.1 conserved exported hypothetical protein [Erythrobacter sp. EC-HK427]